MKMKKLLLTMVLALFAFNVKAQIVYTDIVPDGQPAGIDFNQDNTNEFDISTQNKLGDYIEYFAYGTDNNIHAVGDNTDAWDTPAFQAQGFTVDASNNWVGQGDAYPNGDFSAAGNNPTIIAGTDQYMAVRFNLGGTDIYYGWVRVNIDANGNVTYKDYAYNTTAGASINAGEMPSISVTSITVQGQGGASTITTAGGTLQMVATVLPANATDNSVTWSVANVTGSATIDANGLLTATGDGTVTVIATANDGSMVTGSTDVTISNQATGVNENDESQILLYPNPVTNVFVIKFNSNFSNSNIRIVNDLGQTIKTIKLTNSNAVEIDMSQQSNGVYFVHITNGAINSVTKIIKQ